MSKILGLDLGTNSIGWALVEQSSVVVNGERKDLFSLSKDDNNPTKGVIIFQEGVKREKGNEVSKAAERTTYRSARKLKFRRKLRKYQTLKVLAKNKMCPLSVEEVEQWRKSNFSDYPSNNEFLDWLRTDNQGKKNNPNDKVLRKKQIKNPYYFRNKFSRKKYNWENDKETRLELGRVFYHLAQRRGFLSNRLDQSDKGIIEFHQPYIETIINDSDNVTTLTENLREYFGSLDILNKSSKDLNEGEKKLKTLFNSFKRILKGKDVSQVKKELLERLFKKENLGKVKQSITDLDDKIRNSGSETLGQYFYSIYNKNLERIRNNYTAREDHYLREFEIICKTQNLENINEREKESNKKYSGIVKELYKAIFYQRPLKSQKGLVGKCSFEKDKPRCPVSRPEFEEYRMYSFINNIKIKTPDDERMRQLTNEEKEKIIPKFQRKSKISFDFEELVKEISPKDKTVVYFKDRVAADAEYITNYKLNTSVSGCPTIAAFQNIFGNDWRALNFKTNNVNKRGNQISYNYEDIWHIWTVCDTDQRLKDFAKQKLNLDNRTVEKFCKVRLKKDYASLSLKAINKILPYLKEGLIYPHAVFMANMEEVVDKKVWEDKNNRELIRNEIKGIIDRHKIENQILFCVNSLLKTCKDNNIKFSENETETYKNDLLEYLKNEFGAKAWNSKPNKEEIIKSAYKEFIKHLKAGGFSKIKRIDDKVIDFLLDNNLISDETKLEKLYHPSDIERFKPIVLRDKNNNDIEINGEKVFGLGSPISNSIKNPMAMRTLHQLRRLINTLIKEKIIDTNTKVNIELARDLNDANKRKAIHNWQNDRMELRKIYEEKIKDLYLAKTGKEIEPSDDDIDKFQMVLEQREDGKIVSKDDILKYQLWEEQNHICLYTGETIGIDDFLGSNPKFDIEHTIPRSVSFDNSMKNKTLCNNKFNRYTKQNKLPSELNNHSEILLRIEHWKKKYLELEGEIERLKKASRNANDDRERKDKIIQKRHYLTFERNYWKDKYSRFIMEDIPSGFKNSQIVDTGLITRYAQQYLKSYFNKVYTVKGDAVSEFRKQWGIQEEYSKKDRTNHIHHCIDAITIACMTKDKYDILAKLYHADERNRTNTKEGKNILKELKPWDSFTQDLKNIENEILVVHHSEDKLPVQTKKKMRKRGIIQYLIEFKRDNNGNYLKDENGKKIPLLDKNGKLVYKLDEKRQRIPRYLQGDTARGSLHQQTFYGAIAINRKGEIKRDKEGDIIPNYVVRKDTKSLTESDIKNIVDDEVRRKIFGMIKQKGFKKAISEPIWMNEQLQIAINKIRCYAPNVVDPINLKQHLNISQNEYKNHFYVMNDSNYLMVIYEGVDSMGKLKRDFELISYLNAATFFRKSNNSNIKDLYRQDKTIDIGKKKETLLPIMKRNGKDIIYRVGDMVLLCEDNSLNINWEDYNELNGRLFKIRGLSHQFVQRKYDYGIIVLQHHLEARPTTELKMADGNFKLGDNKVFRKLNHNQLFALVNGIDFIITPTGKIIKINND